MDVREKLVDIVCDATQINGCIHSCNHPPCAMVSGIVDALIENGVTVQEWIPVTERLPEKGQEVLVFDTRENWTGFAWLRPDETWTALGFDFPLDLGEVTHWMPLPTAPKGE